MRRRFTLPHVPVISLKGLRLWPSGWFPCRLDRYLIFKFLGTYFFAIVLIISIAVVFDYNENMASFAEHNAPGPAIIRYYFNFVPYYATLFSSLFLFIAVIFFTSKLADNSEVIAMLAAGVSMNRIWRAYMFSALLVGALNFYLADTVIPHGSIRRLEFENLYKKSKQKQNKTSRANVQVKVAPNVVAYIERFDLTTKTGYNFSLDEFQHKRLVRHLTATSVTYDSIANEKYHWKLTNVKMRDLSGYKEKVETPRATLDSVIMMEPSDLLPTRNMQETMTNRELYDYINRQRQRGNTKVEAYEVELYKRFANPFASFILATIGLSLSSRKRKGGMGMALGVGLGLSATYILMDSVMATMATQAGLMPQIAAWIPNIIYTLIAFFLYRKAPR